jgi:23S rRNA pseudouridine2605 synthase
MRLNKYISDRGISSRRKADVLIEEGHVQVNGVVVTSLGTKIDPEVDRIIVDGVVLDSRREKYSYILLNKPKGVTSTVSDPHAEKTVMGMVSTKERLYPVGRLDKDSRGLVLMTNDGELAFRLTHPRYSVGKKYRVTVKGIVKDKILNQMKAGVVLEDGIASVAEVEIISENGRESVLEMVLTEGKKREIRRICSALRLFLIDLQRIAIGPLEMNGLLEGKTRQLTQEEITLLKRTVGVN